MDGVKPPPELKFNDADNLANDWKNFKGRFDMYIEALEIPVEKQKKKVALLITVAGAEAQGVYENFEYDEDEGPFNYDAVVKRFEALCAPKKNLVFERHKFFTRKQQPGEKARLFLNALKTIAKRCEALRA